MVTFRKRFGSKCESAIAETGFTLNLGRRDKPKPPKSKLPKPKLWTSRPKRFRTARLFVPIRRNLFLGRRSSNVVGGLLLALIVIAVIAHFAH